MHKQFLRLLLKRQLHTTPNYLNVQTYPDLDVNYLCNSNNVSEISKNIELRKGVGNINLVNELKAKLDATDPKDTTYENLEKQFYSECLKIPNKTHSDVVAYGNDAKIIKHIGKPRLFDFKPREFDEISKRLNILRTDQLGYLSGSRSYFVLGELAEIEHALVQFTLRSLAKKNFQIVTVPDILHRDIIESCGMNTRGQRTQVYTLDDKLHTKDLCLSGTSEMALAGYLMDKAIPVSQLPIKLATTSRCFRAETSSVAEEKGIYRVHEFTKVEMFAVSTPEKSDNVLEDLRAIEEENFAALGLHLRVLDMPPHELGAPAYRKYDIEAWLPGRNIFGEISSCSNCTDYQSRRLNIRYETKDGLKYAHTLNGTACAIPRMLIALIETYQNDNGTIDIPKVLQGYLRGKTHISRQKKVPELRLIKNKK